MTTEPTFFAWIGLVILGAVHGINPSMGWLFAVSLGIQEEEQRAVWRALGPLALGHALAIAVVLGLAAVIGLVLPPESLKVLVALLLLGLGAAQLLRHRHPRWGGMRVGARDLTIWSFLMASAHGAGLMALPFVLKATGAGAGVAAPGTAAGMALHETAAQVAHGAHHTLTAGGLPPDLAVALGSTAVHTAGYLLVTGLVAVLVYRWLGLRLLRWAWVNINLLWAGALVTTALFTLVL